MATAAASSSAPAFLRARLASILSVVPLGVWTVVHLWHNLAAFEGGEAWQKAVTEYPHPLAQLATLTIVLLPLAIHVAWGVARLFTAKPNNLRYTTLANANYSLQRLSAIGIFFFLGAHLWLAMLQPRLVGGHAEAFAEIAHEMRFHTPTLIVYILGTLGVSYHLANGLQAFTMSWGLVVSRRALHHLRVAVVLAFGVFLAMSWGSIYALYSSAT